MVKTDNFGGFQVESANGVFTIENTHTGEIQKVYFDPGTNYLRLESYINDKMTEVNSIGDPGIFRGLVAQSDARSDDFNCFQFFFPEFRQILLHYFSDIICHTDFVNRVTGIYGGLQQNNFCDILDSGEPTILAALFDDFVSGTWDNITTYIEEEERAKED